MRDGTENQRVAILAGRRRETILAGMISVLLDEEGFPRPFDAMGTIAEYKDSRLWILWRYHCDANKFFRNDFAYDEAGQMTGSGYREFSCLDQALADIAGVMT